MRDIPTRLKNTNVTEGSLVTRGANQLAHIVLTKLRGEPVAKAITDQDKKDLKSDLKDMPMKDVTATVRRLAEHAAKGNTLTGFTKKDMEWLYNAAQDELDRRAKAKGDKPSKHKPLKWGSANKSAVIDDEDGELVKHFPGTVKRIRERVKAEEAKKSAEGGDNVASEEASMISKLISALRGNGLDVVQKDDDDDDAPESFTEELLDVKQQRVLAEMWDYMYAFMNSVHSIIMADGTTPTEQHQLVTQSLDEFQNAVTDALPSWVQGKTVIGKAGRKISTSRLKRLKAALGMLKDVISEVDQGTDKEAMKVADIDKSKLDADTREYIESLEKKAQDAEAQLEELAKTGAGAGEGKEDVWKNVDPEVKKRFEEMEKRAKEAEEVAKAERDTRREREFISKAREEFPALPGADHEELGKLMKQLHDALPEESVNKIETVLKAANEAVAKGDLFKEQGRPGNGSTSSAMTKIKAKAAELRKADSSLTEEQAITKAIEQNPELKDEYRKEAS